MDAQATKEALNCRAEEFARWLFPAGRKEANEWLVGSLEGEPGKSLKIRIEGDKVGVFKDFADGMGGDNLLALYIAAKRVSFAEALRVCREWLGDSAITLTPATQTKRPARTLIRQCKSGADVYDLSDSECRTALKMAETLRDDFNLCERIARARGWRAETIRQLAQELHLGWCDGKLAFIYDSGAKLRYRENGERIIRWAFGKPWLWRGAFIKQSQTLYLSEGESDAITLIDAGIENEAGTSVVALPSASTFDQSWNDLFREKDVILAFDNDRAGSDATARVSRLLQPTAKSLCRLNWEGMQHAIAS
ncbi:MAG TPA: toprim domain-containing protein [Chthoniobacterales bacterium]|jgi:twinkle protein|nr:toprim domain-containing protein [Chthoniobacterales bacterium]